MRTIILLSFPEEYTYTIERQARPYHRPLESYAEVSTVSREDLYTFSVNGEDFKKLLRFSNVTIGDLNDTQDLTISSKQLLYNNKDIYDIIDVEVVDPITVNLVAEFSLTYKGTTEVERAQFFRGFYADDIYFTLNSDRISVGNDFLVN